MNLLLNMAQSVKRCLAIGVALTVPFAFAEWTHGWETVGDMLWADFAGTGYSQTLTDEQVSFVASTYQIVSLEKCFAMSSFPTTEAAVVNMTKRLKDVNPNVKVLFYYHTFQDFSDCYAAGKVFMANPGWWLYDDNSKPVGTSPRFYQNSIEPVVQDFWAQSILNVSALSGLIDGVFADGTDMAPIPNVSSSRLTALVHASHVMVNSTRHALQALNPTRETMLFGNGLDEYAQIAGHGVDALPYLDGIVYEHFLAFEMLDPVNGTVVPALFDEAMGLILNASAQGKGVLVKAWPGPCTTPILPLGPAWPGNSQPMTYAGRAAAAAQWLTPALAAFLVLVQPNIYLSYSTWYTAPDGYYPCPNNTCSAPVSWYPALAHPLGAPSGPALRTGWTYSRAFEHAQVTFNAANVTASTIVWTTKNKE